MNTYLRKALKISLWLIGGLIILLVIIALSLNIPAVQNFVKDRAITYIKKKTKTHVSLESIKIALPKDVVLNKFYLEDLQGDTLLYAEKFAVDISLFKLLKSQIEINNLELDNIRANVTRIAPDTTFNFSFLTEAFMSDQKKSQEEIDKDTTATLKFSINKFSLKRINIHYQDDVAGNNVRLNLGDLNAKIKDFDLNKQLFVIQNIALNNSKVDYLQQKPLATLAAHLENNIDSSEVAASQLPTIEIENFSLNKVNINFNDQISDTYALVNMETFLIKNLNADLTNMKYAVDETALKNSTIKFSFKPVPLQESTKPVTNDTIAASISLVLKKLNLENNAIQFDNLAEPKLPTGIDFNHLQISNLNFKAEDLSYLNNDIKINVLGGSFADKSGFKLNKLSGKAAYTSRGVTLENFVLNTPNTIINSEAKITYNSLEDLTKRPENVQFDLQIKDTKVGLKDAAYFSDAVPPNYSNLNLTVNASLRGNMNNFNISKLQVAGLQNTEIDIAGNARGLPDVENTLLNLQIKKFKTSKQDINTLVPKGTIPANISLPSTIAVNGNFKGTKDNFNTNLAIRTDLGNAQVLAAMSPGENYNATLDLINFNAGKLLGQEPTLGLLSVKATAQGKGFDMKNAVADVNAQIISAQYNNYTYKDITLEGKIANQRLDVKGSSADENIDFDLIASANLSGQYPQVMADLELTKIDLQSLNFIDSEFKITGNIKADVATADVDYLNGEVFATGIQIAKEGRLINIDTIEVKSVASDNGDSLTLKSEILQATVLGNYQLSKIGQAFTNQINKYYKFGTVVDTIPDQQIRFTVNIYNSKLLKDFVPELTTFSSSLITGFLDTQADSLQLNAWLPQIVYGEFKIDSTRLTLNNANNQLNYDLTIKALQNPSVQLFNSEIKGSALNNILDLNIFLRDRQRKDRYVLGGKLSVENEDFKFSLDPEKLLLNYDKWNVNPDNYISYGASGIFANNFNLSQGTQLLGINSEGTIPNSPLNVTLKDFNIETLTSFAETDSALVGGIINGTASVKGLPSEPIFNANLTIDALRYQKDALGNLRIAVNNQTSNAFEVNAALTGVHEARVNGFYYTEPSGGLDLKINIDKIDVKSIESLSGGQIRQGTGTISGQFSATGTTSSPKILGSLQFNNAGFNIKYVNSYFRAANEKISFTNEGISFDQFTLIDSLNKTARVNGKILTKNYQDFSFNLDLRTDNFRALNSTEKDNELIYGTVYLSSNVKVTGNLNQPNVNGSINVNEGTKFFFALPSEDPSIIEQSGIVQFIDEDAPPFNGKPGLNVDSLTRSPMQGMNLSVNVEIDKEAELNVVIDPSNGDALKVKGEGSLNATIDPSGKTSLTGRYSLSDGSYNLSVGGLARKEFKIQQGSTIVWTGEPTSADIDITALYEVNAAAIDLVADQVETMDASVRNTYKQKMPFQVLLYLTGELMKPTIAFKIDLPEDERAGAVGSAAFAKLQQVNSNESELNKQVFALLALNRFISENPFESLAGGSSTSSIARQSVSKLLTEQLNNLASDLIKGIDINLGVNSTEDYSSGNLENRTDLEVGLSKKLLNDRLTVSVGSTFGLEGSRPTNEKSSNIAGNINVEYLLSADGKYRLRFYRRNETEGVVEGQIIETGVGFALVVEYNRFNEIFKKPNRRKVRVERELKSIEKQDDKN